MTISMITSVQKAEYQQRTAAMSDDALAAEASRIAQELANITAAIAEIKSQELAEMDLSTPAAAAEFLKQPPVQNSEAFRAGMIAQRNLERQQGILGNELRGRRKRAGYQEVAAHLRQNRKTLEAAAAVVRESGGLSGSLGVPAQIDTGFALSVKQALKFADSF